MWQVYYVDQNGLPKTINRYFSDKYSAIRAYITESIQSNMTTEQIDSITEMLANNVPDDVIRYVDEQFDFALIKITC